MVTLFGLYAKVRMINNKQAFKELIEKEPFDIDRSKYTINTNNEIADIDKRDAVYRTFLDKLTLQLEHRQFLLDYGFPEVYINKNNFKSIPQNPRKMKDIVKRRLFMYYMKSNCSLNGIPGFYQNEDFSWNFTSPEGFFIPVLDVDGKIQGLNIELDKEFRRIKANLV